MNIALWIVQGLLAIAYLFAGLMKATRPVVALSTSMGWVKDVALPFVRFIGIAEVLGAIGLILPMVTGIAPGLTVAAAIGLIIVQASAAVFHFTRREGQMVPANLVLLLLAAFILIGRLTIVPAA